MRGSGRTLGRVRAVVYSEMLALVQAGRLRPAQLVTARLCPEDAPGALVAMSDGSATGVTHICP